MGIEGPFVISATDTVLTSDVVKGHIAYDKLHDTYWAALGAHGNTTLTHLFYSTDKCQTWTQDTSRTLTSGTASSGDCVIACSEDGHLVAASQASTLATQIRATADATPGGGWDSVQSPALGAVELNNLIVLPDPSSPGNYLVSIGYSTGTGTAFYQGTLNGSTGVLGTFTNYGSTVWSLQIPAVSPSDKTFYGFDIRVENQSATGGITFSKWIVGGAVTRHQVASVTATHADVVLDIANNKLYGIALKNTATVGWWFYRIDVPGMTSPTSLEIPPTTGLSSTDTFPQLAKVTDNEIICVMYNGDNGDWIYSIYTISTNSWTDWTTFVDVENQGRCVCKWPYEPGLAVFAGEKTSSAPDQYMITLYSFNAAPNAPIMVVPEDISVQDLVNGYTFDWTFSDSDVGDTQSAWAIRRKVGAGAYEYYDAIEETWGGALVWNTGSTSQYTFPASKWDKNTTYLWSINTKDAFGAAGVFADDLTVISSGSEGWDTLFI